MKKVLLLAVVMAMFTNLQAQSWQEFQKDHFDSYAADDYLGVVSDNFTTWSGTTGTSEDGIIIDSVATSSGANCFLINSTSQDVVWDLGLNEKGAFEVQFKYMVGVGKGGYFNFQKEPTPGIEWGGEIYFGSDSTGYFTHAALTEDIALTHTNGEWMTVYAIISLETEIAMLWIGDNPVIEYTFSLSSGSGAAGLNTLGGVNFYGAATAGDDPEYYVDDVTFTRLGANSAFNETMENGMPGMYAAESMGGNWDTWSGLPGTGEDALISNVSSNGGLNAIYLDQATTDMIYRFGDQTAGRWEVSFDILVDVDGEGYYNLMHTFDSGFEWACDVFFNADGTGYQNAAGVDIDFTYTNGEWNRIEYMIDLDNDRALFYLNGKFVQEWQWSLIGGSGAEGTNQLAVMDLYPAATAAPSYHIDNLNVQLLVGMMEMDIEYEDFAAFNDGEYVAQGNPVWSTWSDAPGSAEDAMVTDMMSNSGSNSLELMGGLGTDAIYRFGNTGNLTSGSVMVDFMLYVPADGDGYFNLMHVFDNVANDYMWGLECYFNAAGAGSLSAGGPDATEFTYAMDEWINVAVYVDLDNDYAELHVAGEVIHGWVFSTQTDGSEGLLQLAVMDLYPPAATSHYYMDDIMVYHAAAGLTVEEMTGSNLSVYPNPANDVVFIENDMTEDLNLKIFNAAGQQVLSVQKVYNDGRITVPTATLDNGLYFIQLENENTTVTKRIVVQH